MKRPHIFNSGCALRNVFICTIFQKGFVKRVCVFILALELYCAEDMWEQSEERHSSSAKDTFITEIRSPSIYKWPGWELCCTLLTDCQWKHFSCLLGRPSFGFWNCLKQLITLPYGNVLLLPAIYRPVFVWLCTDTVVMHVQMYTLSLYWQQQKMR